MLPSLKQMEGDKYISPNHWVTKFLNILEDREIKKVDILSEKLDTRYKQLLKNRDRKEKATENMIKKELESSQARNLTSRME